MYFLRGIHGSASFPYLFSGPIPASLAGRAQVETCFGILTATPVAWLALGAPFAWSGHPDRRPLRIFALAVALLFAGAALPILLYFNTAVRYEVDFLPELILLAVLGILGLEGTLARWPATRRIVRWGWGLLLAVSVSFNVVSSTTSNAMMRVAIGDGLVRRGDPVDAMIQYQNALRLFPGFAEAHRGMGDALLATGHAQDSISDFEAVLRLAPESAVGHDRLAEALFRTGRISEALDQCEQAVRLDPADAVYRSHRDFLRSSLPQR
jgi:tetratricopeptide (TPR) repeat protein